MASTIPGKSEAIFTPDGLPIIVLSCYITAFEITPSTDEIDVGTFCAPSLTDKGITKFSAVASLLWEPALYDALVPGINKPGLFTWSPDPAAMSNRVSFRARYVAQPWGRFEVGQRVEVDLPLAVLSLPTWSTA